MGKQSEDMAERQADDWGEKQQAGSTDPVVFEKEFGEACGVFGVYDTSSSTNVAEMAFRAAIAQQHRGQETGGISVSDGSVINRKVGAGVISAVFPNSAALEELGKGFVASSHVRYGTIGVADPSLAGQPICRPDFSIAVNGHWQREVLDDLGIPDNNNTDTERAADYIHSKHQSNKPIEETLAETLPDLQEGAFSMVVTTPDSLIAVRDPYGFRPLMLGKTIGGFAVASETIALDTNEIPFRREVRPGEMIVIDKQGMRPEFPFDSSKIENENLCAFELGYFSSPASIVGGREVVSYRKELGRQLAAQDKILHPELHDSIDLVLGVPDSGIPAGEGYAEASGIPFSSGMMKNRYLGRTFIKPPSEDRAKAVDMKLFPYRSEIDGKSVMVVDDSIVRGNTTRRLVQMLYESGAKEVHVRSAMSEYISACHMGMDTYDVDDLLAAKSGSHEEMRKKINCTTLGFLSLEAMTATLNKKVGLCTSCMTSEYPIEIKSRSPAE